MMIPLDIDDALLAGARVVARREGATLERIIEEGLRIRLAAPSRKSTPSHNGEPSPGSGKPGPVGNAAGS